MSRRIPEGSTRSMSKRLAPKSRNLAFFGGPVDRDVLAEFEREAKRRQILPASLAARVLSTVATDKMFEAILDL